MTAAWAVLAAAVLVCAAWYLAPLARPVRPALPILLIGKTGEPFSSYKDKKSRLSFKRLEKLFTLLKNKDFQTVLPQDLLSGKPLPARPALILFCGGYQTFYTHVFPLLEKYGLKAAVALPAALIGQYDAWQNAQEGPWQNLLDAGQIKQLNKSGAVEFISETLDGLSLENADDDTALWQLSESKTRLQKLCGLKIRAVHFPQSDPRRPAVLFAAAKEYPLVIANRAGNNPLHPPRAPLRVFAVRNDSCFTRLFWKMKRL